MQYISDKADDSHRSSHSCLACNLSTFSLKYLNVELNLMPHYTFEVFVLQLFHRYRNIREQSVSEQ